MIDKDIIKFSVSVIGFLTLYLVLNNTHSDTTLPDSYKYCLFTFMTFTPPLVFTGILWFSKKFRLLLYSSVFIWLLLSFFIYFPVAISLQHPAFENRCVFYIKSLASAERSYFLENNEYATFEELLKHEYIKHGYTSTNLIDQYRVEIMIRGTLENSDQSKGFTIFAYPQTKVRKVSYLRTFYITENEIAHIVESK